jgi:hypothetical protein
MSANLTDPEYKRNKNWYREIVTRNLQGFNQPILDNGVLRNPIDIFNENLRYYYGQQGNNAIFFVKQGTPLESLDVVNNQIFKLSNYLKGKVTEIMEKFNISTDVLSESAKTQKDIQRKVLLFLVENKEFMQEVEKYGVVLSVDANGELIETKEDVDFHLENSYRVEGADIAELIANEILYNNGYKILKPDQFFDVISCGFCSTDREIVNGRLKEFRVLPYEAILDMRNPNDNCFNDAARFRGRFINLASPYEVLEMYGEHLDPDDRKAIEQIAIATDNQYGRSFFLNNTASPTGTFDWWEQGTTPGNPIIGMSIVKMYFFAERDYRYKYKKGKLVKEKDYDADGNIIESNANRKGVKRNWGICQAVVIAGKFVCCEGWVDNAIYDDFEWGKQLFPQTVFIYDYQSGVYTSYFSRLKPYQDDIDLAVTKRKLAEINDLGVNYILWGSADSNQQISGLLDDFKSSHMAMLKMDLDDNGELFRKSFAEVVDFTKALSVVQIYMMIENDLIQKMGDMVHLPSVLQGTQEQTIGKGVQQNTVSLATVGITPLLNGFINFVEKDIRTSSNINKIMFTEGSDYARMVVGDYGVNWLQLSKKETFQNLLIYIHRYDVMDEQNLAILNNDIQPAIQNGLIDFEDLLAIRRMTSVRKIYNYIRYKVKKRKKEQQAQMEQQRQDQLVMAQAANETQLQAKQIPADAVVQAKVIQNQGEDKRSAETNANKKEMNDLQQQVKVLTKQLEVANKKD